MNKEFPCPHCGQTLTFTPEHTYLLLACPYCRQAFTFPNPLYGNTANPDTPTPPVTISPDRQSCKPRTLPPTGVILIATLGIAMGTFMLIAAALFAAKDLDHYNRVFIPGVVAQVLMGLALLVVSAGTFKGRRRCRRLFLVLLTAQFLMFSLITVQVAEGITVHQRRSAASAWLALAFGTVLYLAIVVYLSRKKVNAWFR